MYRYSESGLTNVWLENGYVEKKTPYGTAVAVQDVHGLHQAIAMSLMDKQGRLTGREVRFLRTLMGLSQDGLAGMLRVKEQTVSLWERTGKVSSGGDLLVRLMYMEHANGDTTLSKAMERAKTVERLVHQKIVAHAHRNGWRSKSVDIDEAVVA